MPGRCWCPLCCCPYFLPHTPPIHEKLFNALLAWSSKVGSTRLITKCSRRSPILKRARQPAPFWERFGFSSSECEEGVSLLQEAIKLEPRLIGAHLTLAQAYLLQGKPDRAMPLLQHVLELDPSNAVARMGLVRAQSEKGNYEQALKSAQPVLAALKESPDGLILLATGYGKTNNRTALAGLVDDWSRFSGVPTEWSIKFALQLAQGGAVPEAIDILERTKTGKCVLRSNWTSI